jgi:type I restriction enzyme S subunit
MTLPAYPAYILDMPMAAPPLTEQHAIVAHLDRETAKLDALTTEAERAVALLKERRAALISAAVTGKIDVRGEAEEAA